MFQDVGMDVLPELPLALGPAEEDPWLLSHLTTEEPTEAAEESTETETSTKDLFNKEPFNWPYFRFRYVCRTQEGPA